MIKFYMGYVYPFSAQIEINGIDINCVIIMVRTDGFYVWSTLFSFKPYGFPFMHAILA